MLADVFQGDNLLAARAPKEKSFGRDVREADLVRKGDVPMNRRIREHDENGGSFDGVPAKYTPFGGCGGKIDRL